jgi:hypothetical protein
MPLQRTNLPPIWASGPNTCSTRARGVAVRRLRCFCVAEMPRAAVRLSWICTRQPALRAQEEHLLEMLSYASDAGHAPARLDYGLALTEGRRDEDKIMQGLYLIAMTCRDGDIGYCLMRPCSFVRLLEEALGYERACERLERPALEDHPMALTLLSLMYRDGLGVDCNTRRAFELTLRAAEAGYSKVNLGIDVATLEIRATEVTDNVTSDAPMLPCLLDQIPVDGAVTSVSISGDCAYDTASCHEAIAQRGPQMISPTRKDAKP